MRSRRLWAVVALAALVLSAGTVAGSALLNRGSGDSALPTPQPGATSPPAPDLARFYEQTLTWRACGGAFVCTELTVPLDYANPDAGTMQVAVNRLPASNRSARIGALVVNPGGPGVPGTAFARAARAFFPDDIRRVYDIVGFDPRGTDGTAPVDCVSDRELDRLLAADGSPDTPAEVTELQQLNRSFAAGCERNDGKELPFLGTRDTARDMDVLRAALGEDKLDYFGGSYGTYLGAVYADAFPQRVGRLVLDGAVDPSLSNEQYALGQAQGFERALGDFLDDCLTRSDCPFSGSKEQALADIQSLLERIDATPLPTRDPGRPLTQALALLGLVNTLYVPDPGWSDLRSALAAAEQGNGQPLLEQADQYADRRADGTYARNTNESIVAISCLDRTTDATPASVEAQLPTFAKAAPILGPVLAWSQMSCADWPVPATERPRETKAVGAAPILVIGTTGDPATPYAWAEGLAKQLDSGVLLTRVGEGHTAYASGNGCIDSAVDTYLLDGTVPPDGTVCR